jgi:hypothetical protein
MSEINRQLQPHCLHPFIFLTVHCGIQVCREWLSGTAEPAAVELGSGPLANLMWLNALYPVFQPIAALSGGAIYAHEALIKGPEKTLDER